MIGSGKTTLGERLAAPLGRPFLDLDREMDRELGRSFHALVQEQGWLAFREVEYRICKRVAGTNGIVCALGGGTARYEGNRDGLRGSGITGLPAAGPARPGPPPPSTARPPAARAPRRWRTW